MDTLWAPWRMEYIMGESKPEGCLFCQAQDGKGFDDLVLAVSGKTLVMMNKYPYNNAHLLVAPVRHVDDLNLLEPDELVDLAHKVNFTIAAIRKIMTPDGFNVGLNLGRAAGAGIEDHLHFHVVPRWNGDSNFMTVLGEVRSVPEHIRTTKEKLLPHFADFEQV